MRRWWPLLHHLIEHLISKLLPPLLEIRLIPYTLTLCYEISSSGTWRSSRRRCRVRFRRISLILLHIQVLSVFSLLPELLLLIFVLWIANLREPSDD